MANPEFNTSTATASQARGVEVRRNLTSVPFETAVELQSLIVKAANSDETTPSALAQLARAWSELEDRKRIIKMKPAPKPVDVTELARKRKPAVARGFTETPTDPVKPKPESKSNESGPAPS